MGMGLVLLEECLPVEAVEPPINMVGGEECSAVEAAEGQALRHSLVEAVTAA